MHAVPASAQLAARPARNIRRFRPGPACSLLTARIPPSLQANGTRHGEAAADEPRTLGRASLNQVEQLRFLRAIEAAVEIRRRHELFRWLQGEFQTVIPHKLMVCTLADGNGVPLLIDRFSNCPVPGDVLQEVCSPHAGLVQRLGSAWLRAGARALTLVPDQPGVYPQFETELRRYGLLTCCIHGLIDHGATPGSQFVFFGIPAERPYQYAYLLELLVPYLHTALIRVRANDQDEESRHMGSAGLLTGRELEILQLVRRGHSNSDVAAMLDISPLTVKNHVQRILRKLGAQNRAQAVSRAIALQALPPDAPASR